MEKNIGCHNDNRLRPFLKWAGGKRWFVANHDKLLPKRFNRYIEPFLGSGVVFFHLQPENAVLGDYNGELIDTYRALKENWKLVYRYLKEHHRRHSRDYYYKIRCFQPRSLASRAARFIYLNRTCWNGLYRVNKAGFFNVPKGTKSSVIFNNDNFDKVAHILQAAELYTSDFEYLIDMAEEDDFVFVDPPYTVRHNNNSFIKYNEKLFSWSDQERLFKALRRAKNRNVQIVGTNAHHGSLVELYEETFAVITVRRNSSISSKVESRKMFEEIIFFTEEENE